MKISENKTKIDGVDGGRRDNRGRGWWGGEERGGEGTRRGRYTAGWVRKGGGGDKTPSTAPPGRLLGRPPPPTNPGVQLTSYVTEIYSRI